LTVKILIIMKNILRFIFFIFLLSLIFGHFIRDQKNYDLGEKIIGFSVIGGAFIFLPLFLFNRLKGKKLSDYTLDNQNIKKLSNETSENIENH